MANERFAVTIKETLCKTVIVNAKSYDEAVENTKVAYRDCKVILEADDWEDTDFIESAAFGSKPVPEDSDLRYFTIL